MSLFTPWGAHPNDSLASRNTRTCSPAVRHRRRGTQITWEIVQTFGAKRGKRVLGCTKGASGTRPRSRSKNGVHSRYHRNFGTVGVNLNYTLWDFGKRRAAVRERGSQLAEAEQNLERLKEEVAVAVERSYNKLERTRSMVNVATQVAQLRQESERLATNQATQGVVLVSDVRQATAASYEAKAELLQARLGYLLAWAELERTIGRAPGLAAQ